MPRRTLTHPPFCMDEHAAAYHVGATVTQFRKWVSEGRMPSPDHEGGYFRHELEDARSAMREDDGRADLEKALKKGREEAA